jgi:acetamidase/formamidase
MAVHFVEPTRESLHGAFSRDWPPILTIDPGDTVCFRTLDAGWNLEGRVVPPKKFEPRIAERDNGHALCGPIAIRGAEPGMMLAIQIDKVVPGSWGWSVAGGWDSPLNRRLGIVEGEYGHNWELDVEKMTGRNQYGHIIRLSPFMGVMGMPPDTADLVPSWKPRIQGGNIDCKELVTGSTLYLPIAVAGGLFSTGDGHALQGDGEISSTGIECPMERVEMTFQLETQPRLQTPYATTPAGWITFGFHEDLNEATMLALEAMLHLMQSNAMSRRDAVALASLCVDLRITQIVNGVRGVHAVLPHDAIKLS